MNKDNIDRMLKETQEGLCGYFDGCLFKKHDSTHCNENPGLCEKKIYNDNFRKEIPSYNKDTSYNKDYMNKEKK